MRSKNEESSAYLWSNVTFHENFNIELFKEMLNAYW